MHYLIYEIRNNKNGKVYIGKHKTKDINDNYMGSGKLIKRSIEKYGIENFTKTILFELETEQEMNEKEAEIVNEEFARCESNYNLMVGGQGGNTSKFIDYEKRSKNEDWLLATLENSEKGIEAIKWLYKNDKEWLDKKTSKFSSSIKEYYENGGKNGFFGKQHSEEFKEKMKGHTRQKGEKNSQFGSMWIHSLTKKVSKKIKKDEFPEFETQGWFKGRKMKF